MLAAGCWKLETICEGTCHKCCVLPLKALRGSRGSAFVDVSCRSVWRPGGGVTKYCKFTWFCAWRPRGGVTKYCKFTWFCEGTCQKWCVLHLKAGSALFDGSCRRKLAAWASTTYFHSSNSRSSTNFNVCQMKAFCKSNMNWSKLQPPAEHVPASTTYFHSSNARSNTNFNLRQMKTFCKSNMNRPAGACSSFNNLLMLAFLLYWCWFSAITNQSKIDIRSIQKFIISLIAFLFDLWI